MSPDEKLIYNANQIGKFFRHRPEQQAVRDTADHLNKYWDPRMRREIVARLQAGGAGLDPIVKKAVESIANDERSQHADARQPKGE